MSRRAPHNRPLSSCAECHEREASGPKSARCTRCQRREYVRKNREKVRQQKKDHYRRHCSKLKEKARQRYHKTDQNSRKKLARRADPERFSGYARTRYERHSEAIKSAAREYYRRNPDVAKAASARYRSRKLLATIGLVDFGAVRDRSAGRCGICSRPINDNDDIHFDHITPLSKGGAHCTDNLQLAHAVCNRRKKDRLNFSL